MKSIFSPGRTVILLLVFVSASLAALPSESALVKLNSREISYFFRCAFQKEDPTWMWTSDTDSIRIGGSEFSALLGGAQHIRYSALPTCITHYAQMDFSDGSGGNLDYFHGLSVLSGIPLYQERQEMQVYSNEINYFNPALIKWIQDNMIPDPNARFTADATFQKLYDIVARRNARILAYTLVELKRSGDFQKYYKEYLEMDGQSRVDMKYTILRDSPLHDSHSAEETDEYGYNFAPGHAATFWFRREMDGTADEVMALLKAVFARYDSEALGQL